LVNSWRVLQTEYVTEWHRSYLSLLVVITDVHCETTLSCVAGNDTIYSNWIFTLLFAVCDFLLPACESVSLNFQRCTLSFVQVYTQYLVTSLRWRWGLSNNGWPVHYPTTLLFREPITKINRVNGDKVFCCLQPKPAFIEVFQVPYSYDRCRKSA